MNTVCIEENVIDKIVDSRKQKSRIAKQGKHDRHSDESCIREDGCSNEHTSLSICDIGPEDYYS